MFVPIPFIFILSDATTVIPVEELDISSSLHWSEETETEYSVAAGLDLGLNVPP